MRIRRSARPRAAVAKVTSQPRPASQWPKPAELRREVVVDEEDARRAGHRRPQDRSIETIPRASEPRADRQRRRASAQSPRGGGGAGASIAGERRLDARLRELDALQRLGRVARGRAPRAPTAAQLLEDPLEDAPLRRRRRARRRRAAARQRPPSPARATATTVNSNPGSSGGSSAKAKPWFPVSSSPRARSLRGRSARSVAMRAPSRKMSTSTAAPRFGRSIAQPPMRSGAHHVERAVSRRATDGVGGAAGRGLGAGMAASGWRAYPFGRARPLTRCQWCRTRRERGGFASLLLAPAACLAPRGRPGRPAVTGPPETVYDWATERCATWDIPDTPARAWRAPDGSVRLVAGAEESRAAAGPDLAHLTRDCRVLYRGAGRRRPGAYDDRAWIHSTWTADGVEVVALAHVEYHGEAAPGRCHAGEPARCWRNAIVELRSDDGGRHFARAGLAAALPWRYSAEDGRRAGYFNPSNIVRRGDAPLRLRLGGGLPGPAPRRLPAAPAGRRRPRGLARLGRRRLRARASPTPTARTSRTPRATPAPRSPASPAPSRASSARPLRPLPRRDPRHPPRPGRGGASGIWWMTSDRPPVLERARAPLAGAAALAPRLRRAGGLRLPLAPRPGEPRAQLRHRGRGRSGSTSSRCRSAPAAASGRSAT